MNHHDHFDAHLTTVLADFERALERSAEAGVGYGGVVLHSGAEVLVHRDDQPHLFRQDFNFARVAPLPGPDHLAVIRPGERPKLIRVVPHDYWYEAPAAPPVEVGRFFDYVEVSEVEDAIVAAGETESCAFLGDDLEIAAALGIEDEAIEPDALMASLDWDRAYKTRWEVECVREAAKKAAPGHAAVRAGAAEGLSERELHHAYIAAAGLIESEVPYPNIIGWDQHAAVLHYQSKDARRPDKGKVLLIDAGASHLGYACDVTRTWAQPDAGPLFAELLDGMEELQRELVAGVRPESEYIDLHAAAHEGVARILTSTGILKGSVDEVLQHRLTLPFLPHGLGHHMGLQVHDVAGHQVDPAGTKMDPPAQHPFLRTTRPLEAGHIVTIEPGLYFIPMLLEPVRGGEHSASVDWDKVDALIPCGGIRIEDDIHVTADGREDLTRPLIPGHRD